MAEQEEDFSFYNDTEIMNELLLLSFRINFASAVIFTVISIVGIVANGLVVYKVVWHKHLQTKDNFFIANLAAADTILFLALIIPVDINFFTKYRIFANKETLVVVQYVQHVCIQATAIILVGMSFSRYKMAVLPLKARAERATLRVWMCCAFAWLVSILIYIPLLFGILYTPPGDYNRVDTKLFAILTMFLLFILPFSAIVFCYARIISSFRKGSKMVRKNSNIDSEASADQSRKLTRMVLIIICVFFLSWAPIQSYLTWLTCREHTLPLSPENWRHLEIFGFCTRLTAYLGGAINPFIYAYTNPSFKRSNMFRLKKASQSSLSTGSTQNEAGSWKSATNYNSDKSGKKVAAVNLEMGETG